jgi:AraC-like DNA-binding protein
MYFGNLFKQQVGMSFRQYLTSIRLNQAENLLLSGEYRVGEVADLCGFSDAFYFSKVYRKEKGISPSKVSQVIPNN